MPSQMETKVKKVVQQLLTGAEAMQQSSEETVHLQPDKSAIITIIEQLQTVLFPDYFIKKKVSHYATEYYIGSVLDEIYTSLTRQITLALLQGDEYRHTDKATRKAKAEAITSQFIETLPRIQSYLAMDVEATFVGDPAAFNTDEIIFSYPGLYAIMVNRLAHELHLLKVPLIPRIMTEHAHSLTGIDIHPGATIGKHFFIDHAMGVIIGETAVVGDNCTLYQGVTLGGTGKDHGKRHPTVESGVIIGAGAKVLGPITLGRNVKVGAGAIVLKSVPEGCTVVGNPGRIVRRKDGSRPTLDHANLPDPMLERMQALYHRLTELEKVLRDCACRLGCDQCAEDSAHCPLKKQDHSNENPAS